MNLAATILLLAQVVTATAVPLARVQITTQPSRVDVQFSGGSGAGRQFIGIYTPGAAETAFLDWIYLDNKKEDYRNRVKVVSPKTGMVSFFNLKPGNYEARLCDPTVSSGSWCSKSIATFNVLAPAMPLDITAGGTVTRSIVNGSNQIVIGGPEEITVITDSGVVTTVGGKP